MVTKNEHPDSLESLRALLNEHNLTTIAKRLAELLTQAETAQLAYSEFLHEVLSAE